jgi:hypothetical protein
LLTKTAVKTYGNYSVCHLSESENLKSIRRQEEPDTFCINMSLVGKLFTLGNACEQIYSAVNS